MTRMLDTVHYLGFGPLGDVGSREIRHALKVAALCLGCSYLGHQRFLKVAEQQVLLGHMKTQQAVEEAPVDDAASKCLRTMDWPAPIVLPARPNLQSGTQTSYLRLRNGSE